MEALDLNNNKKLLKIKLSDLNILEYIKETILSVLNNPGIAINTQLIKNDSSILLKIEKNNIELARVIITEFISKNNSKIWYVNSLKKSNNGTSRDIFLLKNYLEKEVLNNKVRNLIINVRAYSGKKHSHNLDKKSLKNFYYKMGFTPTKKTLFNYLSDNGVENINFNLLRIKWQLVWENNSLKK